MPLTPNTPKPDNSFKMPDIPLLDKFMGEEDPTWDKTAEALEHIKAKDLQNAGATTRLAHRVDLEDDLKGVPRPIVEKALQEYDGIFKTATENVKDKTDKFEEYRTILKNGVLGLLAKSEIHNNIQRDYVARQKWEKTVMGIIEKFPILVTLFADHDLVKKDGPVKDLIAEVEARKKPQTQPPGDQPQQAAEPESAIASLEENLQKAIKAGMTNADFKLEPKKLKTDIDTLGYSKEGKDQELQKVLSDAVAANSKFGEIHKAIIDTYKGSVKGTMVYRLNTIHMVQTKLDSQQIGAIVQGIKSSKDEENSLNNLIAMLNEIEKVKSDSTAEQIAALINQKPEGQSEGVIDAAAPEAAPPEAATSSVA